MAEALFKLTARVFGDLRRAQFIYLIIRKLCVLCRCWVRVGGMSETGSVREQGGMEEWRGERDLCRAFKFHTTGLKLTVLMRFKLL